MMAYLESLNVLEEFWQEEVQYSHVCEVLQAWSFRAKLSERCSAHLPMGCTKPGVCQLCTSWCCVPHVQPGKEDPNSYSEGQSNSEHTTLETYLVTIWLPDKRLLLAHCTSYAKNHLCRQKENWHKIHCFLNPSGATANNDSPVFSSRFSEAFQTIYFLCATEGNWSDRPQMSASNGQTTEVQSPLPRLKTRSTCSASLQTL